MHNVIPNDAHIYGDVVDKNSPTLNVSPWPVNNWSKISNYQHKTTTTDEGLAFGSITYTLQLEVNHPDLRTPVVLTCYTFVGFYKNNQFESEGSTYFAHTLVKIHSCQYNLVPTTHTHTHTHITLQLRRS